ncbi:hypothetical protein BDK51DRAFT_38598 [Blyttiomyces helicus]|uniref:Uncharacterized protein n=1 Tax=Blyttiomyces helicus TaxID=388810 RepID=A0A4P9W0K0_9FUNG|nr:hypothetical protein BDK51DRAFT_38598 [Blyttiomyces helicus]|eukprot:RKO83556.1 hypothetical protein BDK51DRAFT_38598 [Blyttiomyces helicus]
MPWGWGPEVERRKKRRKRSDLCSIDRVKVAVPSEATSCINHDPTWPSGLEDPGVEPRSKRGTCIMPRSPPKRDPPAESHDQPQSKQGPPASCHDQPRSERHHLHHPTVNPQRVPPA